MGAIAEARGDIRLANSRKNLWRIARAVIRDRDLYLARVPIDKDLDMLLRELRGIVDEIAKPVHDFRLGGRQRLGLCVSFGSVVHGDAGGVVRLTRCLSQCRDRHKIKRRDRAFRLILPLRQLSKDGPTTGALAQQEARVFPERAVGRQVPAQFFGDDGDGAKRAAKLVRSGCGQRASDRTDGGSVSRGS